MYLNSINYFRGISILCIVFGHCFWLANITFDTLIGKTIYNLTQGGTSFFVFISGFLFHHVFFETFEFKKFMIKKTKYVLFPYLILSTIPILYILFRIYILSVFSTSSFKIYEEMLSFQLFSVYLTGVGNGFIGYWYIPFIMIVFTMSPLFVRFIKLKLQTQIVTALFFLICSVFIHRGTFVNVFAIFQNVFFFIPVYLFGITCSGKKDVIYTQMKGKEFYLLSFVIALALFQAYIGKLGSYHKDPFVFGGIDLMIIQKILLCLFFMIWLNRFENQKFRLLEIIAVNSFGIFFIHGILIAFFFKFKEKLNFTFTSNSFIMYCFVAIVIFSLSLIVTLLVKKIFPKNSRYLIGS